MASTKKVAEDDSEDFGRSRRPLDPAQVDKLIASAPAGITAPKAEEPPATPSSTSDATTDDRREHRRASAAARARTHQYPLRIPLDLYEAIEERGKAVGNSFNTYVLRLLRAHLEGRSL
jgi:hypothetical protein